MPIRISTIQELSESTKLLAEEQPELIAVLLENSGTFAVPSKKNKFFKLGNNILPMDLIKSEYHKDIRDFEGKIILKTIVLIPPEIASDKLKLVLGE